MSATAIIPISLPKQMARDLDRAARRDAMTRSEYVRNLIRRQLAFAGLHDLQKEVSSRAKSAGIRSLGDAVRAVRSVRAAAKA